MGEKPMKRSTKRTVGWGSGAGIGVTFVVLTFVVIVAVQNGGMKNLHGQDLVKLSQLNPAAGEEPYDYYGDKKIRRGQLDRLGEDLQDGQTLKHNGKTYIKHGDHWHDATREYTEEVDPPTDCGVYHKWVGALLDSNAVSATGKKFRILKPNQAMTMDHNPERINVFINDNNIVLSVRCG